MEQLKNPPWQLGSSKDSAGSHRSRVAIDNRYRAVKQRFVVRHRSNGIPKQILVTLRVSRHCNSYQNRGF